MTGTQIITSALGLAGNSGLDATEALAKLNRLLDRLYRLKFSWQRQTASVAFTSGVVVNTANWPSTFLDIYEHEDGSVGRYTNAGGDVSKCWGRTYRQYIGIPDRLTTVGPPLLIAYDPVAVSWYVYPKTDQAYTVSVDYYQKPAAIAAGDTPLWSTHASDDLLVDLLKTWAYEWQDDERLDKAIARALADLGSYRRKDQAREGVVHQSALDPRIFRPAYGWDC